MAIQAAIGLCGDALPSTHEKVDQDQYKCRHAQQPGQKIFAHRMLLVVVISIGPDPNWISRQNESWNASSMQPE